jgi:hypothetical protein
MTKEQTIADLKAKHPSLTYGINDEVFQMSSEQYQETINLWADAAIAKEQAIAEAIAAKDAAQAKLAALGLTTDDLKALGLGGN